MNPAIISAAIDGVVSLVTLINQARAEARRSGVMSPEEDAAFDARLQESFSSLAWQPSGTDPDYPKRG